MQAAIETFGLCKRYKAARVLDGVSATIPPGEIIGLLGHNGAGKTTLLKLVLGLIRPSAGTLRVLGSPVGGAHRRGSHRRIGYLPENVIFYNHLTARETITYLARLKGRPNAEGTALLARVGLASAADKRVHAFSKGMRQRLGIAQALLGDPDLLLLDEPTAGLDPIAILEFLRLIHDLRAKGKTIIVSSHLLAELEPHLDRAVVLSRGRVVATGKLSEMRDSVDLPITIRARLAAGASFEKGGLAAMVVTRKEIAGGTEVELKAPRDQKLDLIRRIIAFPGLTDVSVKEPTLPEIYARISGATSKIEGAAHA